MLINPYGFLIKVFVDFFDVVKENFLMIV